MLQTMCQDCGRGIPWGQATASGNFPPYCVACSGKRLAKVEQRERKLRVHFAKTCYNMGRMTFKAYADMLHLTRAERKEQYRIVDLITDVLTFARRKGFNWEEILESVRGHVDAETMESCPKCGGQVTREFAYIDEGEDEEAGRTFYYCSEHCRETH